MGTILFFGFISFVLVVGISVRIYLNAYKKDPAKAKSNLHTILYGFNTGNTTYLAEKAKDLLADKEKEKENTNERRN